MSSENLTFARRISMSKEERHRAVGVGKEQRVHKATSLAAPIDIGKMGILRYTP